MFLTESASSTKIVGEGFGPADPREESDLIQIVQEAEAAWSNICVRMVTLEHKAIVTEDADLLQEAAAGFIEKVKEWAKRFWAGVKRFFSNLWDRIAQVFMSDEKWFKARKADIAKAAFTTDHNFKVKAMPSVVSGAFIAKLDTAPRAMDIGTAADAKKSEDNSAAKVAKQKLGMGEDESSADYVKKQVFGDEEPEEIEISLSVFKTCAGNLEKLIELGKNFKKNMETFHKAEAAALKTFSEKDNQNFAFEVVRAASSIIVANMRAYSSALNAGRGQLVTIVRKGLDSSRAKGGTLRKEGALFGDL